MFQVGDKVVYPLHGAGIIEAVEDHEVLGRRKRYYIMRLPINDMKVMVPCDQHQQAGLRQVISESVLAKVIEALRSRRSNSTSNWNHRYRANMEKIRSGDVMELADVVGSLSRREKEKGLSTGERKMLDSARQILLSEIVLAKDLEMEQANSLLDDVLAK